MYISLCTIVVHNTAWNSFDNLPLIPQTNTDPYIAKRIVWHDAQILSLGGGGEWWQTLVGQHYQAT